MIRLVTADGREVYATPNMYGGWPQIPGPARFAVSREYEEIVMAEFLYGTDIVLEVTTISRSSGPRRRIVSVGPHQAAMIGYDADNDLVVATRMPNPSTWRLWNLTNDRHQDSSSLEGMPEIYRRQYDSKHQMLNAFSSPHWFGFDDFGRLDEPGMMLEGHCSIYGEDDAVIGEYRGGYALVNHNGARRYLSPPKGTLGFLTVHMDGSTVRAVCYDLSTPGTPGIGLFLSPPPQGHHLYELSLDSPTVTWRKAGPALYSVAIPKKQERLSGGNGS